MDLYLKIVWLVGVAAAQYDYTPPQRAFNAGGGGGGSSSPGNERPTYGLPGHTPGAPQGLSDFASAAGGGLSIPNLPTRKKKSVSLSPHCTLAPSPSHCP
jgi:hypothetical protein